MLPTPKAGTWRTRPKALETMQVLGLRWRAENIIEVARALIEDFDGGVRTTSSSCARFPGVGDYVAQAVLCFGFGRRAVLMDTNTARIVGQALRVSDRRRWQLRLDLYRSPGRDGPDAEFNYALLDLGALVCRRERRVATIAPSGLALRDRSAGVAPAAPAIAR